jgi:two-component system, NtrC family, sensor kinase
MYKIVTLLFLTTIFFSNKLFAQENINKLECFSYLLEENEVSVENVLKKADSFKNNNCENFNFGINTQVPHFQIHYWC